MFEVGTGHFCINLTSANIETHINDVSVRDKVIEEVLAAATCIDEKGLKKLHHLYGHASTEKLLKFLKKSGKVTHEVRGQLKKIEKTCDSCNKTRRRKPRPKTAMPRVDDANQIVTIDLKVCDAKSNNNKHGLMWTQPERTGMNWNELESWKRLKWI